MAKTTRTLSDSMLTRAALPSAGKSYYDIWDAKQGGLFVRIGKLTKTFYCYDSRERTTKKIGKWGYERKSLDLDVEQAREIVRKTLKNKSVSHIYGKQSLGDYIDNNYRYERLEKPVTESTIKKIKSDFSDWMMTPIASITKEMLLIKIAEWRAGTHTINTAHHTQRSRKPVKNSESTIRKKVVQIKALFNTLVKQHHIAANPFVSINLPKDKPPKNVAVYNDDVTYTDVMRFIFEEDRPVDENTSKFRKNHTAAARVFIATVIILGLRDAEARLNKIENFVTTGNNKKLIIPAAITKTKTGREIPIENDELIAAINTYKSEHYVENPEKLMFYNKSTNKVFSSSLGRKLFDEIKERFNLGEDGNGSGRKYDFRHTFATRLYNCTGDIKLVSDAIGDNIDTTNKFYAAQNTTKLRNAIGKLK